MGEQWDNEEDACAEEEEAAAVRDPSGGKEQGIEIVRHYGEPGGNWKVRWTLGLYVFESQAMFQNEQARWCADTLGAALRPGVIEERAPHISDREPADDYRMCGVPTEPGVSGESEKALASLAYIEERFIRALHFEIEPSPLDEQAFTVLRAALRTGSGIEE